MRTREAGTPLVTACGWAVTDRGLVCHGKPRLARTDAYAHVWLYMYSTLRPPKNLVYILRKEGIGTPQRMYRFFGKNV